MKKLVISAFAIGVTSFVLWATGVFSSQSFLSGVSLVVKQPTSGSPFNIVTGSTTPNWTNSLGQLITNGTNSIGTTYGAWDKPVRVFANGNGDAPAASISITTKASGTTNTIALTFQRSVDGVSYDTSSTWGFTTQSDVGAGGITTISNVPTTFLTGAQFIRLSNLSFATNSFGYTNYIDAIRFNGFVQ